MAEVFNAATMPWISVLSDAGDEEVLSLIDLFSRRDVEIATGDPAFDHGLHRFCLSIVYTVLGSPRTEDEEPDYEAVVSWLGTNAADTFEIGHSETPFMQSATDFEPSNRAPFVRTLVQHGANRTRIGHRPFSTIPTTASGAEMVNLLMRHHLLSGSDRRLGSAVYAAETPAYCKIVYRPAGRTLDALSLSWVPVPVSGRGMFTFRQPEDRNPEAEAEALSAHPLRLRLDLDSDGVAHGFIVPDTKKKPDSDPRLGVAIPGDPGSPGSRDILVSQKGSSMKYQTIAELVGSGFLSGEGAESAIKPSPYLNVLRSVAELGFPVRVTSAGGKPSDGKIIGQFTEVIDPQHAKSMIETINEKFSKSRGPKDQDAISLGIYGPTQTEDESVAVEAKPREALSRVLSAERRHLRLLAPLCRDTPIRHHQMTSILSGVGVSVPRRSKFDAVDLTVISLAALAADSDGYADSGLDLFSALRIKKLSALSDEIRRTARSCQYHPGILYPALVEAIDSAGAVSWTALASWLAGEDTSSLSETDKRKEADPL